MVNFSNLSVAYLSFNRILSLFFLVISLPLITLIALFIKLNSPGGIIFQQERIGHNSRKFILYKFRTMINGAELLKNKYRMMNYANGPAFKIKNDPRFTRIGKFLSESHLDELPQLFNVIRGDMLLVGFRPPLYDEVKHYKKKNMLRFEGYPGITSIWAVNGGHKKFNFDGWVKSDIEYEKRRGIIQDSNIILKTIKLFTYLN